MTDIDEAARGRAQADIRGLRARISGLDGNGLDLLFRQARTFYAWRDKPVGDDLLKRLFDIFIMGPTASNILPARLKFLRSSEAKERLCACVNPGNVPKIMGAPVTAIVAYDTEFYEQSHITFPLRDISGPFRENAALAEKAAFRNGSIQGAYLILAARALGLDTGPMSGFRNPEVDAAFFEGSTYRSNFLCNIGYGDETSVFGRLPRFQFDQICEII